MPKVSVIIPTYNNARYLCEAIESVLRQTFKDYEIIVVDDGSTDDTKEKLERYLDKITYIFQNNSGPSCARNRGIKESRGDYIAFLDEDDLWFKDKLVQQVALMNDNPTLGLSFTDAELFNENGLMYESFRLFRSHNIQSSLREKIEGSKINDGAIFKGFFYKDMLLGNLVVNSTAIIRKEISESIYLDEKLLTNGDYDLWIRIAYKHPILYLNRVTTAYRLRENALSGKADFRGFVYRKSDGAMFEKYLESCPLEYKSLIMRRISECYHIAAWGWLNLNSDLQEVRNLVVLSLKYNLFQPKLYFYFFISFLPLRFHYFLRRIKAKKCLKSV